ncbi:MAG: GIY-YIG nuclease family protein [Pelagibacterales bacterium]|nr:GIY-YIG nuclease family protein [Pelagibacterales bacterium]
MVNYKKSCIYKIVCNDPSIKDFYIGSTTNFTKRKWDHKATSINENEKRKNLKLYKTIRENGGWYNWNMVLIENVECNHIMELRKKEREFFDILKPNLNMIKPAKDEIKHVIKIKEPPKKQLTIKQKHILLGWC